MTYKDDEPTPEAPDQRAGELGVGYIVQLTDDLYEEPLEHLHPGPLGFSRE